MDTKQFVNKYKITADVEWADSNPNMAADDKWMAQANHYRVTLRYGRRQMTVPFSTGSGWTREPSAADVLDNLASDAAGVENARDFEDWAGDYGYDVDSRKAEKTFRVCKQQAAKLRKFLGDVLYDELLWKVERM